jgi:hypothetical protein
MTGSDDTLTPRQHAAIAALLTERTLAQAAKKARVAETTLRRWLGSDDDFLRAYRTARRALMDTVIGRLQQTAAVATDALKRNLTCGRPGDEIRAAVAVLDHATRGLELGDLMERVEELERFLGQSQGQGQGHAPPPAAGQTPRASSEGCR